jgi:hypothetical protein
MSTQPMKTAEFFEVVQQFAQVVQAYAEQCRKASLSIVPAPQRAPASSPEEVYYRGALDIGPKCPRCGGATQWRKANGGFWSCLSYPQCRGTVDGKR